MESGGEEGEGFYGRRCFICFKLGKVRLRKLSVFSQAFLSELAVKAGVFDSFTDREGKGRSGRGCLFRGHGRKRLGGEADGEEVSESVIGKVNFAGGGVWEEPDGFVNFAFAERAEVLEHGDVFEAKDVGLSFKAVGEGEEGGKEAEGGVHKRGGLEFVLEFEGESASGDGRGGPGVEGGIAGEVEGVLDGVRAPG